MQQSGIVKSLVSSDVSNEGIHEVYAGYRHIEDDTPGFADHNLFVTGMRVTFK